MPDTWELASILVRSLLYLGALASVGQVLVRIVFHRETSGLRDAFVWRVMAFATLAFLSALVGFALKGAAMVGELSGMTDPVMLGILWQTPVGTALVLRVAGLVTILVAIWIPAVGLKIAAAGGVVVLCPLLDPPLLGSVLYHCVASSLLPHFHVSILGMGT